MCVYTIRARALQEVLYDTWKNAGAGPPPPSLPPRPHTAFVVFESRSGLLPPPAEDELGEITWTYNKLQKRKVVRAAPTLVAALLVCVCGRVFVRCARVRILTRCVSDLHDYWRSTLLFV